MIEKKWQIANYCKTRPTLKSVQANLNVHEMLRECSSSIFQSSRVLKKADVYSVAESNSFKRQGDKPSFLYRIPHLSCLSCLQREVWEVRKTVFQFSHFLHGECSLDVDHFLIRFQPFASGLYVVLRVVCVVVLLFLFVRGLWFSCFREALAWEHLLQLLLKEQAHCLAGYRHLWSRLPEEEEVGKGVTWRKTVWECHWAGRMNKLKQGRDRGEWGDKLDLVKTPDGRVTPGSTLLYRAGISCLPVPLWLHEVFPQLIEDVKISARPVSHASPEFRGLIKRRIKYRIWKYTGCLKTSDAHYLHAQSKYLNVE